MSMNLFFVAFPQDKLDQMANNHALIDESIDAETYVLSTDIETAWDVLRETLGGTGIDTGEFIDNALFNGCFLMSSAEVKTQAEALCNWTHEKARAELHNIDQNADLYRLKLFQNEEEYFLEQFDKMAAFYKEAAEKNLGAISYVA